jgi:rifampicin phosphotransferase
MALAQMTAVRSTQRATTEVLQRTENPGESFSELVETLRWLYATLVRQMFSLTAASGPILYLLRYLGVLEEHSARQPTISSRMFIDLEPLRDIVDRRPSVYEAIEQGALPDHDEFRRLWTEYLARYGHRGIYESDISRPRYHEAPEILLHSLTAPPTPSRLLPRRTLAGRLTWPLWWQASKAIRAREQWRHDIMTGFDRVRRGLLELASQAVERSALPDVDALWMLTIDEARLLDTGWVPGDAFFRKRAGEIEQLKTYHLPDLIHRFDDLEQYRAGDDEAPQMTRLTGVSLAVGEVRGRAWVLDEPAVDLPDGFEHGDTILVARAVDAGWIPTFAQVAGVVVEMGGDLSHGSIILREIGLPAVTNARGAVRSINTGDWIRLNAARGLVEIEQTQAEAAELA